MNKINRLLLVIASLFIIFIYVYITPKNYELKYKVNNITVKETYNKEDKYYLFEYTHKNNRYKSVIYNDYTKSRKLIKEIKIVNIDNSTCIVPLSKELSVRPLCSNASQNISYHLIENAENKLDESYFEKIKPINEKYKNISINYLNDRAFIIWYYNGMHIINKDSKKSISLFDKDVYEIDLAAILNNYFIIPNYDDEYYFDLVYLYDIEKDKKITWELNKTISFDSYVMGGLDNSLYLFDKKQKIEYELVPHKKKLRKVTPKVLKNGIFHNISSNKLLNNKEVFSYNYPVCFELKDNKLYKVIDDYKELISKNDVTFLVHQDKNEVYYLVGDSLYMYNDIYGEVKLMSNFEWNFNYENLIFVY